MNGPRHGLIRGSMMIAASSVISGSLSLVISVVLTRTFGVEKFGFYSITASLQSVAIIFSGFGLGPALAKYISEYAVRDARHAIRFARTGLRLVFIFSGTTALVYWALSGPLGNGLYGEPGVTVLIPFSALVVVSSALLQLLQGIVQGKHQLGLLSMMQISVPLVTLCIILAFVKHSDIQIAFIAMFVAQMAVTLMAMVRMSRLGFSLGFKVEPDDDVRCGRLLLAFAVPAVASGAMVSPVLWLGNTLLAVEAGFLAVGQFAVAIVFYQVLAILPNSLVIPLIPRISEMSVKSRGSLEQIVSQSIRVVGILPFPLFFALALFSELAVNILYGREFSDANTSVYLMVCACYFMTMSAPIGAAFNGLGRMWVGLGLNIIWAALVVSIAIIAIPSLGPGGLGLAYASAYVVHLANSVLIARHALGLRIRGVFSLAAFAIAMFAIGFLALGFGGVTSMFARFGLLAFGVLGVWLLGRSEIRLVIQRILGF